MVFGRNGAFAAALLSLAHVGLVSAEQILVASLVDDIVYADLISTGDCHSGCRREEHAVAHITETPEVSNCELQTITPFDSSTPEPGLLRASIYCEDSTGALIEEGTGPCVFDICVDFSWKDYDEGDGGQLTYDVVIERTKKPRAAHTVYIDLSVAIDPTASNTNVDSCAANGTCASTICDAPFPYTATISMTDEYGDGWVGGVSGYYNTWSLTNVTDDSVVRSGTLADNHESATTLECLGDGDYIFNTTANAAFADDMGWGICDENGLGGEGLKFTIEDGVCLDNFEKIERATADETDDASASYCTLPAADESTSTCSTLSSGLKIDGVGLYYDERCTRAQYAGCGARSIEGCRICFVDRDQWKKSFPNERVPDWEDCPCCVADIVGVDCATGGGDSGIDKGVIIGVSVGIVGVIAIAVCLSCAFGSSFVRAVRRINKKRDAEMDLELETNVASAFPESPTAGGGGGTIRGTVNPNQARGRGNSGHFPIPRFDSIRGRFDSGIFASNTGGATQAGSFALGGGELDKIALGDVSSVMTAQSTPSVLGAKASPSAPRSTVLDERIVKQGLNTSDVGHHSGSLSFGGGGGGGGAAGWGLAMAEEYPEAESPEQYKIDNALAETGTERRGILE